MALRRAGSSNLAVMQGSRHYQETKQDGGRYSASSERCAEIIRNPPEGQSKSTSDEFLVIFF